MRASSTVAGRKQTSIGGKVVDHALVPWQSYYVILGSSAAALTGLQFIVIVLGTQIGVIERAAIKTFGTPAVVHFAAVLFVSALLSAPWHALAGVAVCLGIFGVVCALYVAGIVLTHARRLRTYQPVLEDWIWFFAFPLLSYLTIIVSAFLLARATTPALFAIAGSVLLLLFTGIHNAWDSATYIAVGKGGE